MSIPVLKGFFFQFFFFLTNANDAGTSLDNPSFYKATSRTFNSSNQPIKTTSHHDSYRGFGL